MAFYGLILSFTSGLPSIYHLLIELFSVSYRNFVRFRNRFPCVLYKYIARHCIRCQFPNRTEVSSNWNLYGYANFTQSASDRGPPIMMKNPICWQISLTTQFSNHTFFLVKKNHPIVFEFQSQSHALLTLLCSDFHEDRVIKLLYSTIRVAEYDLWNDTNILCLILTAFIYTFDFFCLCYFFTLTKGDLFHNYLVLFNLLFWCFKT